MATYNTIPAAGEVQPLKTPKGRSMKTLIAGAAAAWRLFCGERQRRGKKAWMKPVVLLALATSTTRLHACPDA